MASSPPASHRLSFDPAFDARLRALLDAALPRIVAHAARLRPRLLLLTGSAACGEACAVGANGGFLPLSSILMKSVALEVSTSQNVQRSNVYSMMLKPNVCR